MDIGPRSVWIILEIVLITMILFLGNGPGYRQHAPNFDPGHGVDRASPDAYPVHLRDHRPRLLRRGVPRALLGARVRAHTRTHARTPRASFSGHIGASHICTATRRRYTCFSLFQLITLDNWFDFYDTVIAPYCHPRFLSAPSFSVTLTRTSVPLKRSSVPLKTVISTRSFRREAQWCSHVRVRSRTERGLEYSHLESSPGILESS